MQNKRRHKRVPLSASVAVTHAGGSSGEALHAMAANISLSGIGLYSDRPIEPETDVSLTVHFISKDGGMATDILEGSIVYVKEIGDMYFMGVEFGEEMNRAGQPSLYEHLMSILVAE